MLLININGEIAVLMRNIKEIIKVKVIYTILRRNRIRIRIIIRIIIWLKHVNI